MTFSPMSPPSCYGRSYDNDSPVCSSCSINSACRQEIMKVAFQPQFQPPAPPAPGQQAIPYQPYRTPTPYQPPTYSAPPSYSAPPWMQQQQPSYPPQQAFRVPVATAPQVPAQAAQQMVAQAVQHVLQGMPYSPIGVYGAIPDPAIAMLSSIPPIFRPQMTGETFWVRVLKNLGARLLEVLLDEAKIAIRQAVFPPVPTHPPVASQTTVDVSARA